MNLLLIFEVNMWGILSPFNRRISGVNEVADADGFTDSIITHHYYVMIAVYNRYLYIYLGHTE
jgi:hypothetical protein